MHNYTVYCMSDKGLCVDKFHVSQEIRDYFPLKYPSDRFFTFINIREVEKLYIIYI